MGKVRDLLRGIGLLSSAGIEVSNAGTRLLNIRNELNRLANEGASGREKPLSFARAARRVPLAASAVYVGREKAGNAFAAAARNGKSGRRRAAKGSPLLEERRRKAREYMRRKRAKERKEGITNAERERRRKYNREQMRRYRARRKG